MTVTGTTLHNMLEIVTEGPPLLTLSADAAVNLCGKIVIPLEEFIGKPYRPRGADSDD